MGFIIKLVAIMIGASALEEPKPCNCTPVEQNVVINEKATIHIIDYTRKKCKLDFKTRLVITPDNGVFTEYVISVHSSKSGLLSKQTISGATTVILKDEIIVSRKEKIWIEIVGEAGIITSYAYL